MTDFAQCYERRHTLLPGNSGERDSAARSFARMGFPGVREEAWKYTNLRALVQTDFATPLGPATDRPSLLDRVPAFDAPRIVFVDGHFRADLSTASAPDRFAIRPSFGRLARPDRDNFVALNTMMAEDGVRIAVPTGVDAGSLLVVMLATDTHSRPIAVHPRHHIDLGAGARLTLIEVVLGDGVYLHNPVTEITLSDRAMLSHLRLQDEAQSAFHISTIYADLATRATYDSFLLNMGARLSRHDVRARIGGDAAVVHLNCAQMLRGGQLGDFTTVLAHDAAGGRSRQTVRNVLDGAARGVFQGRIEVARIAQKTDGFQMNHALLLSPDAEMDSKPELRINADDVKCSHGATVGELDAHQLFYLRSRGISAEEARAMLIRGFLSESLADIADEHARAVFAGAMDNWWGRDA